MEITFNKNLKRIRGELNLQANEIAKKLNVAATTVSAWEKGKSYPDVLKLIKLCEILNVSLEQIIFGHEDSLLNGLSDLQKFIIKETVKEFKK
ncbi:MAG: helix-turn-helix domain-containing protein [Firmicutes bacterium]|nr:helix-turn-helix domain-containing protein [Bacillota bacterium]